jgi:hypothetical protein
VRPMIRPPKFILGIAILFTALLATSLLHPPSAFAQTGSASLSGRVTDQSNAVVPDVEVEIKNVDTNVTQTTKTNGDGIYSFPALPPGNYLMNVRKLQFRTVTVTGVQLHTQDSLARNFVLQVGSSAESVTVNASASSIESDNPAVSLTVTREFVEDMPLNGRSFQDLIQLTPGTVSASTTNPGYYSINGQRTDANNFTVDGVSANLGGLNNSAGSRTTGGGISGSSPAQTILGTTQGLASVDSLAEFKIQTSGYTAESGRSPGGQVQLTTRSGTNDLHGTLFDYFRNTALDANSYFNNHYGMPRQAEHQNDFGGTIGGPVVIPHVYDGKAKTFFFFSYEGLRLLLPSFESEYVPTQAFRNSASPLVQPYLNVAPLPSPNSPGNQDGCTIPDPSTGLPTACDALFNYSYSYPNNLDNINLRIDQKLGSRFTAFVRYADTPSSSLLGAEAVEQVAINVHSLTVGVTGNLTSSLLNEVRFNYSRDEESQIYSLRSVGGSVPLQRSLVIPPVYDSAFASSYFPVSVPGSSLQLFNSISGGGTTLRQYNLVDSVTWTRGVHSIKFGIDFRHLTTTWISQPYTSVIEFASLSDIQQGYTTSFFTQANAPGIPVFKNLSLYAQDHWRINPRLSIDYGLRWEFNPPPGPSNGYYPVTLTSDNLATAQLTNDVGTQPYKTNYHSFAPRFGFAWNAIQSQKHPITVRGGFGIFFDTGQQRIGNGYSSAYPFTATSLTQNEVPLPLSAAALAPPSLNFPLTPPYPFLNELASPNLTLPYTEQWNLSLDAALSPMNTLTASYVGNNGRKLLFTNYYGSVPGNSDFANGLYLTTNGSQSSYNALQVQDRGRIANGLDLVGSFTWAHALDNESSDDTGTGPLWGNSDNDVRSVLNLALNYQIPTAGPHGWMQSLTHGWVFANRFSAQSGNPLPIIQTNILLPNGSSATYYPDLVPNVPIYLHGQAADVDGMPVPGNWRLNPAAFALVPTDASGNPLRQGTLGRNFVRTPPFWALNTSLQRSFPIHDRFGLDFRVDAFNVLNHPNLNSIDPYLSDSTFGHDTGNTGTIGSANQLYAMGTARSLQLSLKLRF